MNRAERLRTTPAPVRSEAPERPPVILQRWRYSRSNPEQLVGYVYNHPNSRFADGNRIRASLLVWIHEDVGLAQTLNTLYVLRDRAG
jgi:hypothetical protein